VETVRRIVLTGILGVIAPGTAVQVVVGMMMTLVFIRLYSIYGMSVGVCLHNRNASNWYLNMIIGWCRCLVND
jgi:hypothetical protein